jgi:hypothetical protein
VHPEAERVVDDDAAAGELILHAENVATTDIVVNAT